MIECSRYWKGRKNTSMLFGLITNSIQRGGSNWLYSEGRGSDILLNTTNPLRCSSGHMQNV